MGTKLVDTTTHVTNVLFALGEPRTVLCLGGCTHDRAYTLRTTSTPCLHTQSCLVSLCLKTSSMLFEIHRQSCLFTATCGSHQCCMYFSPSAALRRRERDLKVSCVWCYSLTGQNEICELKSYPKTVLVHMQTLVCGQAFYTTWQDLWIWVCGLYR